MDPKIEKMNCSGIYKLNYKCRISYVGEFKQRLQEHKYGSKFNLPEKSKFTKHLLKKSFILNPITKL